VCNKWFVCEIIIKIYKIEFLCTLQQYTADCSTGNITQRATYIYIYIHIYIHSTVRSIFSVIVR